MGILGFSKMMRPHLNRFSFLLPVIALLILSIPVFGADRRIQYNERIVGANHPTLADTVNKTNLYVDVMEYGAKCDDTTDDAAAIQAAVDYAAGLSPNAAILFPPGVCRISVGITLYSDMRFMGAASGNGISIISPTASMADGEYLFKSDSLSRVYIDNLSFRVLSGHAKYQTVHGIKAWGLNRWQMRNVYMNGFNIALDIRKGATQEANNGQFDGLILQYSKTGAVVTGQDIRFIHPTIEQNKMGMLIGDIYASGDAHNKSITLEGAHFETNSVGAWIGKGRAVSLRDTYAYYSNIHVDGSAFRTVIDGFDGYGSDVIDNGIRTSRKNYHSVRVAAETSPTLREFGTWDGDYLGGDSLWRSCVARNPDFANSSTSGWTATNATLSIPDDTHEAIYGNGAMRLISTSGVGYVESNVVNVVAAEDYLTRFVYNNLKNNTVYAKLGIYKGTDSSLIAESPQLTTLIDTLVPNLSADYRFVTTIPSGETTVKYRISTSDTDANYGTIVSRADMVKSLLVNGSFGEGYTAGVPQGWEITTGATGAKDITTYRVNQSWELTATGASARIRQTAVPVEAGQIYLIGGYIQTDSAAGGFEVRWGEAQYQRILRALPANTLWSNSQSVGATTFIPFSALFKAHKTSDNILSLSASNLVSGEKFRVADFYMIPVTGDTTYLHSDRERALSHIPLTLSGAGQSAMVMKANANYTMRAARLIYSAATSADAGVVVSIGIRRNGASSNSYFTSATSEISKAQGDSTELTLSSMDIRKGDVVYAYTAGGKTGAGDVLIEVEYE